MSLHHLGPQIDIHGGGNDLIYPHHENEIAQSETYTGKRPFTRFWLHTGMARLAGAKMSKSDGNMVFVRQALERVPPEALRLYLLDSHYRRAFDHDEKKLARAVTRQGVLAERLGRPQRSDAIGRDAATRAVMSALEDDLHTDRAIRELERRAKGASERAKPSLRAVAHEVLGIV
jgi:cysteinyl-tRNA synthetase